MTEQWPQPWGDILPDSEDSGILFDSSESWVDFGPVRFYDETVYINFDSVWETDENRNLWMPLGDFFAGQSSATDTTGKSEE